MSGRYTASAESSSTAARRVLQQHLDSADDSDCWGSWTSYCETQQWYAEAPWGGSRNARTGGQWKGHGGRCGHSWLLTNLHLQSRWCNRIYFCWNIGVVNLIWGPRGARLLNGGGGGPRRPTIRTALIEACSQRVLCVPASSTSAERVFWDSGLIVRPNRAKMSNNLLESLTFLKFNLDLTLQPYQQLSSAISRILWLVHLHVIWFNSIVLTVSHFLSLRSTSLTNYRCH